MYQFLHSADIHLDSPLLNLDRYDGAPVDAFRSATRRALDNLVELAIDEQVRFVLISGDLYDGDCPNFNTPIHFRRQLERLREHDIRVYIIQGNHDAANKMQKAFRLQLPDNVHLFRTDKPETVELDSLDVAIHGQGFARRDVQEDLSAQYPPPVSGCLNVGMLHTSCGHFQAHDRYAPSSVAGLSSKGYDYWALGHIHQRRDLAGGSGGAHIVYPGNPQGRHINESGPKGCVLVTVNDKRIDRTQFRPLDVLRWQTSSFDASQCYDADAVLSGLEDAIGEQLAAADGRPLAVRIRLTGTSPAHRELTRHADHWVRRVRESVVDRFGDQVWVEKVLLQTLPIDQSPVNTEEPNWSDLVSRIQDVSSLQAAVRDVQGDVEKILKQIPTDPRMLSLEIDWEDDRLVETMLSDVKELLLGRLT